LPESDRIARGQGEHEDHHEPESGSDEPSVGRVLDDQDRETQAVLKSETVARIGN